jgi:hypothetical protein
MKAPFSVEPAGRAPGVTNCTKLQKPTRVPRLQQLFFIIVTINTSQNEIPKRIVIYPSWSFIPKQGVLIS